MGSLLKISVSFICFFLSAVPSVGSGILPGGAAELGMGLVCDFRGALWSALRNPATLAGIKNLSAGINYENRFLVRELSINSAGLIIPAGKSTLGITTIYYGVPDYRNYYGGLACGLKLDEKISAGARIDLSFTDTYGNYDNKFEVAGEISVVFNPSPGRYAGISVFNPVPSRFRRTNLPSAVKFDGAMLINENLYAGAGIEFRTDRSPELRAGFGYSGVNKLTIRGGFSTLNTSFSFGLGCMAGPLYLDIGFSSHIRLGVNSSVSLTYHFK